MAHMSGEARPIGYWLKLLDRLLEEDLDRTLVPFDLNRRQWQILNVLAEGPSDASAVYRELNAFFVDEAQVNSMLALLKSEGWIDATLNGETSLTDAGNRRLTAALNSVRAARQRISFGIEADEYNQTVNTLRSMCENLGWTEQ